MSDRDPGVGRHLPPDRPGQEFPPGEARLTGSAYPPPAGAGAQPPGPHRRRRSHTRLWIMLGAGTALLVVLVVIIFAETRPGPGSGVPPGPPPAAQLARLLPPTQALPAGWYLVYARNDGGPYTQPGTAPPRPVAACYDFNVGTDLGVPGDTFVSSASETAQYGAGPGDGFLRVDLFSVLPGDGAAAIKAMRDSVTRCSSYTDNQISYAVTATSVPGLGDESLDVHVTQLTSTAPLKSIDTNMLVVRVGNDLVVISCQAPPQTLITSLASMATPIIKKVPAALTLPTSAPPGPEAVPAPSPNLSVGQLERLLPVHAGLPAEYYQGQPLAASSNSSGGPFNYPLARPPATLSCNQIPQVEGTGLTGFDVNYRNVADLDVYDPNSNALDVVIDEPSSMALADADFSALKEAAARCPTISSNEDGLITTYRTVVTSVPGLGNENINIQMNPTATNTSGEIGGLQDILLVRVGGALVMVDYSLSIPGQAVPSVAAIARPVVGGL